MVPATPPNLQQNPAHDTRPSFRAGHDREHHPEPTSTPPQPGILPQPRSPRGKVHPNDAISWATCIWKGPPSPGKDRQNCRAQLKVADVSPLTCSSPSRLGQLTRASSSSTWRIPWPVYFRRPSVIGVSAATVQPLRRGLIGCSAARKAGEVGGYFTARRSRRSSYRKCLGAALTTAVQSQRLVLKMANRTTAAQIMITAEAMKPARAPNPG
jgi:hypothetical protein